MAEPSEFAKAVARDMERLHPIAREFNRAVTAALQNLALAVNQAVLQGEARRQAALRATQSHEPDQGGTRKP